MAATQKQPMHDIERLKTLPLCEVIRWSTGRHVSMLTHWPHQADSRFDGATPLAAVDKLAPELRSLTWLMVLAHGWVLPDKGDDLYNFFYFPSGDLAPQVRDALEEAAFAEQSQVLSEAMALFGPNYPIATMSARPFFPIRWSENCRRLIINSGQGPTIRPPWRLSSAATRRYCSGRWMRGRELRTVRA